MTASEPSLFDDDEWRVALKELSERIAGNEADSIQARWEFGRVLRQRRDGKKQLPPGVMAEVVKTHGISQREANYRMKFADKFTTEDEVRNALQTYGSSWRSIVSKALPAEPPKPKSPLAAKISRRLYRMAKDAQALEDLFRDRDFGRCVDELREEWCDDVRDEQNHARPGIRFVHQRVTGSMNKALDELTVDQGQLFVFDKDQSVLFDDDGGAE
ncbi:hypothetical protein [Mycobacterium conspicuum]|uniref:Uncharacterized protein n=1 Tax=Mycobacterium conspicuum TaxID=44010 RepID=A0A1X1T398_9MYCO|nr:hypothetical protein [Mycobacterium conspicuum]ORV38745.1 hypothetical protein AWC00_00470 [Mycobacterium conspicuum]BBZ41139.1 hypothetical protein MCNS_42020 [Mycobacterium conspicuum]